METTPAEDRAGVLIVDDRADTHVVYRAILEDLGQDLVCATSGEQALMHVLRRDFAVILLDVNMPGLDGFETAALIRGRRRSAHVPIIFITADYGDEMRTTRGYSLGAVDFMVSPVVPEVLRTKVKVFVDLYLLARNSQRQAEEQVALAAERKARAAAERASQQSAFLSRASATLSGSLIFAATTRALARLPVPFIADVCALTLAEIRGLESPTEIAWVDPDASDGLASETLREFECERWREAVACVMRDRKIATFTVPAETAMGHDGRALLPPMTLPRGPQITSLALVPLVAPAGTLGVLSLGIGPSRREIEPDLLAVAEDLASRAAMALDNALLYRTIHEQDRRKNEFLAMLSHELRNPLAPITNAAHILHPNESDPRRIAWIKDVISRQVKQLTRLVDDLLDVSRITQGKIELQIESIDVAAAVNAAVETARPMLDAQEHALAVILPPQPLRVKGDSARLAQVLANLLNNSAKYTDRKGRISLLVSDDNGEVVFRVRDSGIGIPPESLSSVFELFAQVEQPIDRSQGGLGIGLTVVKQLVEMQGGTVEAHSAGRGQGSEFTVRLPAATGSSSPSPSFTDEADDGVVGAAGYRVLVVDDNIDAAQSTAMLLRMEGYDVQLAFDGSAVLDNIQKLEPDAVVLDIGLPGLDGFQVAERIRAMPEQRGVLLIAVTGYGQPEDYVRAKRVGFDDHIVKPLDPSRLLKLLAAHRGTRAASSEQGIVPGPAQSAG